MKRILIVLLLVILATSYIAQKKHVIKNLDTQSLQELMRSVTSVEAIEKPKAKQPKQETELMAYPPPPEESLPGYPASDNSPTRTPLPTPTQRTLPTPAPTMNPLDD